MELQVAGLLQVSEVKESESSQSKSTSHSTVHSAFEQAAEQVPGSEQVSIVSGSLSSQSVFELHSIVQPIGVFTQAAMQVSGFVQESVVMLLLSSQSTSAEQSTAQGTLEQAEEQVPGSLQESTVKGSKSSQSTSAEQSTAQGTLLQLESQAPGLLQVSVVKELESSQSKSTLQTTLPEQPSAGQVMQVSVPSQTPFPQHSPVAFPKISQSGSTPKQPALSQLPSQVAEQPPQKPPEQYSPAEQVVGVPEQHCVQVVAFRQILVPASRRSQPVTKSEQPAFPLQAEWHTLSEVAEQSAWQQSFGQFA